jgi:hypothetical protein
MMKNTVINSMTSLLILGLLALTFTEGSADTAIRGIPDNENGPKGFRLLKNNKGMTKNKNKTMPKKKPGKTCNREKNQLNDCKNDLQECIDSNPIIVPTAALLSDFSAEATSLPGVGCDSLGGKQCGEQWVYCIDAVCAEPDEDKLSICDCILQTASSSRLPPSVDSGATCVYRNTGLSEIDGLSTSGLFGDAMCTAMKNGALISTFGTLSQSPETIPNFADEPCPPETPFTYCWGAICEQNDEDVRKRGKHAVQCKCPYVKSPEVNIQVEESQCLPEIDSAGTTCAYLHNGNPSNQTDSVELALEIW